MHIDSSQPAKPSTSQNLENPVANGGVEHPEAIAPPKVSPVYLSSSESSPSSLGSEEDSLPRKGPNTQTFGPVCAVIPSVGAKNVYSHIWKGVVFLASDPYPEVADAAQQVVHSLHDKVGGGLL